MGQKMRVTGLAAVAGLAPWAIALAGAVSLAPTAGCGDDAGSKIACDDPDRVAPPEDTVPYAAACCADRECVAGKCASFGGSGRLCTKSCKGDGDCKGFGPEKCTQAGVCAADVAPPSTD